MLSASTRDAIAHWVAARLDVPPDAFDNVGIVVKAHGPALAGYVGVYMWVMAGRIIVSTPPDRCDMLGRAIEGQPQSALISEPFWRAVLGERIERVVGPSYQGFLDANDFRLAETMDARPLTPADRPALERFVAACPPSAWNDSAIAFDHDPIFGLERNGELIALASAPPDSAVGRAGGEMRSVGVVTLPGWRGRGAGRAVVSALTVDCLERGAILHYQTLRANIPSVAIACALGYTDVATAFAVRLWA